MDREKLLRSTVATESYSFRLNTLGLVGCGLGVGAVCTASLFHHVGALSLVTDATANITEPWDTRKWLTVAVFAGIVSTINGVYGFMMNPVELSPSVLRTKLATVCLSLIFAVIVWIWSAVLAEPAPWYQLDKPIPVMAYMLTLIVVNLVIMCVNVFECVLLSMSLRAALKDQNRVTPGIGRMGTAAQMARDLLNRDPSMAD